MSDRCTRYPLTNFFGRLDYQLNDVHRLVVRYNYATGERLRQQNNRNLTTAVYSSNFHDFKNVKAAPVVQLFSNFKNGSFNEMFVGYNNWYNRRTPKDKFPQIRINTVVGNNVSPTVNGAILAGADQFSQGNELDTKTWEFTDNFTKVWGKHTAKFGGYTQNTGNLQGNDGVQPNGNITSFSGQNPNIVTGRLTGSPNNPLVNFIIGNVTGYQESNSAPVSDMAYQNTSFYADDALEILAPPKLTVVANRFSLQKRKPPPKLDLSDEDPFASSPLTEMRPRRRFTAHPSTSTSLPTTPGNVPDISHGVPPPPCPAITMSPPPHLPLPSSPRPCPPLSALSRVVVVPEYLPIGHTQQQHVLVSGVL